MAADAVTFNSLSRDHGRVKDKIPADFAVGYLSTPSLGITRRDPRTTLEDILSYFDLTFNSLSRDHGRVKDKIPADFAVGYLSTPSLGITRRDPRTTLEDILSYFDLTFNSLSRDHPGSYPQTRAGSRCFQLPLSGSREGNRA